MECVESELKSKPKDGRLSPERVAESVKIEDDSISKQISLNEKITILDDENTKLKLKVPESESDVHESQSDSSQQDIEAVGLW
ncbi:hypothetical protein Tco_1510853 [Tanacetum coccineum]